MAEIIASDGHVELWEYTTGPNNLVLRCSVRGCSVEFDLSQKLLDGIEKWICVRRAIKKVGFKDG